MKILLGTLLLVLGIVGILMSAAGNLPPELGIPGLDTVLTILGILIIGLGWQDELESGRTSLIDLVKKFFASDPFRMLGLNILLAIANQIIDSGMFSPAFVLAAQVFIAIAAVFGFGAAYASYRVKLYAVRSK